MSFEIWLFIQMIVLMCYASWIAYRAGYDKGFNKALEPKIKWKDIK